MNKIKQNTMDKTFMILILLFVALMLYGVMSNDEGGWFPKLDKYLPKLIFLVGLILIILFGVKTLNT